MQYENILVQEDGNVAIIKMNRPSAMNALNKETLEELDKVIDYIQERDEIYSVIITGEGKAFVAGADIAQMKDMGLIEGKNFGKLGNKVFRKIEEMTKPTIAAINGFALGGGCELAMACDLRIASEKAKFGQPEVGLGITPGFGGTQRLARIVGIPKAKEMIYTGKIINSQQAFNIGLVNHVVDSNDLIKEAKSMANSIANNAPIAVRFAKEAINKGIETDIETGISYETEVFGSCFATQDQKEGMQAFIEKRSEKHFMNR